MVVFAEESNFFDNIITLLKMWTYFMNKEILVSPNEMYTYEY